MSCRRRPRLHVAERLAGAHSSVPPTGCQSRIRSRGSRSSRSARAVRLRAPVATGARLARLAAGRRVDLQRAVSGLSAGAPTRSSIRRPRRGRDDARRRLRRRGSPSLRPRRSSFCAIGCALSINDTCSSSTAGRSSSIGARVRRPPSPCARRISQHAFLAMRRASSGRLARSATWPSRPTIRTRPATAPAFNRTAPRFLRESRASAAHWPTAVVLCGRAAPALV